MIDVVVVADIFCALNEFFQVFRVFVVRDGDDDDLVGGNVSSVVDASSTIVNSATGEITVAPTVLKV